MASPFRTVFEHIISCPSGEFTQAYRRDTLVLDEVDRARSKSTKRIHKIYKQKHKASGGYVNGQTVIVLLLVTSSITIPVGFVFYQPDPVLSAWNKEEAALKKKGVPKSQRAPEPERNPDYPTKLDLALGLLHDFVKHHSGIKVSVIMADALYGEGDFMDKASSIFGGVQTISQLRKNQNIIVRNKKRNWRSISTTQTKECSRL